MRNAHLLIVFLRNCWLMEAFGSGGSCKCTCQSILVERGAAIPYKREPLDPWPNLPFETPVRCEFPPKPTTQRINHVQHLVHIMLCCLLPLVQEVWPLHHPWGHKAVFWQGQLALLLPQCSFSFMAIMSATNKVCMYAPMFSHHLCLNIYNLGFSHRIVPQLVVWILPRYRNTFT